MEYILNHFKYGRKFQYRKANLPYNICVKKLLQTLNILNYDQN